MPTAPLKSAGTLFVGSGRTSIVNGSLARLASIQSMISPNTFTRALGRGTASSIVAGPRVNLPVLAGITNVL